MTTGHLRAASGRGWRYDLRQPDGRTGLLLFERLDAELPDAVAFEPAVVSTLLYWMRGPALELRVHGPLSRTLLRNLHDLQTVWHRWRPDTYHHVEIVPDDVVDDTPTGSGAVSAFSGGVDACYTVFRHLVRPASPYLSDLRECVLVQGFDIGLDEDDVFARAAIRAEKQLAGVGLPLARLRTNAKRDFVHHWEDEFGLLASGALLTFSQDRRQGLLSSDEPYDTIVLPNGSTPVQDWMASTGAFEIRHDGAGRSRCDKVAELTEWPEALPHLRVCWKGEHHDRNCGRCEKCLRTMLNFLSVNSPIPDCFDSGLDLGRLRELTLGRPVLVSEFDALVRTASRHGIDDPWVAIVRDLVRRHRRRPSLARRAWRRGRRVLAGAR